MEDDLAQEPLANPKTIAGILTSERNPVLPAPDIDLIRRQLEAKCRDIEY